MSMMTLEVEIGRGLVELWRQLVLVVLVRKRC